MNILEYKCNGQDCEYKRPYFKDHIYIPLAFTGIYILLFIVITIQQLFQSLRNKYVKVRVLFFISACFELLFSILHTLSMFKPRNKIIGLICRLIPYQTYIWLSLSGYIIVSETIKAINVAIKSNKEKYIKITNFLWLSCIIIHIILGFICMFFILFTKREIFDTIYYTYLSLTVFFGMSLVLFVSTKVSSKLNIYLLSKQAKMNIASLDDDQSKSVVNYSKTDDNSVQPLSMHASDVSRNNAGWNGPKFESLEAESSDKKIKDTLYHLKIVKTVVFLIDIIAFASVVLTLTGIKRNATSIIAIYAPYSNIRNILLHYLQIFATYIGVLYYTWIKLPFCTSTPIHTSTHSIAYKIMLCCGCCLNKRDRLPTSDIELGNNNNPKKQTSNTSNEDIFEDSIQTIDVFMFRNVPKNNINNINNTNNNIDNGSGDNIIKKTNTHTSILFEYTKNPKQNIDPETKDVPLNRITSEGRRMGKQGIKRPKKVEKWVVAKNQKNANIVPIANEKDQMKKQGGDTDGDALPNKLIKAVTPFDMQIKPTESLYEDEYNITLIISEFDDIFTTRISRLNRKNIAWMKDQTDKQLQLLFGGKERIDSIVDMFKTMYINNENSSDTEFNTMLFALTSFQSGLIIELAMRVGLNQYLESNFGGSRRLSHIIGCESRLIQNTSGKKDLIILRLMNFLNREHDNVLYIGTNEDECDRLKELELCHVYHVKNEKNIQGMKQYDIDLIQKKYFTSNLNIRESKQDQ